MRRKDSNPFTVIIVVILIIASAYIAFKGGTYLSYKYGYEVMVEQTIKALVREEGLR